MDNKDHYLEEIKEIKRMMEHSTRFLSLSGLSGILVGIYALVSSYIAYKLINQSVPEVDQNVYSTSIVNDLMILAGILLILSFATVLWLTFSKIKKSGKKFWTTGSRHLLINLAIPLITGGIIILILSFRGIYSIVAPSCLIFYGLALVNSAKYTHQEIFYMGLLQIGLGLLSAIIPTYALLFWAFGFGVVHIVYGVIMYLRYERGAQA